MNSNTDHPAPQFDPAISEMLRGKNTDDTGNAVALVVRLTGDAELPDFARMVSQFGNIATVRVARDRLPELLRSPALASAETARRVRSTDYEEPQPQPPNHTYAENAPEPETRRPSGLRSTGRGIVVGCLDWGCDFALPDFRLDDGLDNIESAGRTRLLALWDQRNSVEDRSTPNRFGYGKIHSRADIDAALEADDPYDALNYRPSDFDRQGRDGRWRGTHAAHVLSIAAGNGRGGGPVGVAPDADLVFVHLSGTTPVLSHGSLGDSVTVLEALDFIFETAGDRPCVVNMSVGAHGGPHDGSTHVEQAIDAAVTRQTNRTIVNSAGNYRTRRAHAQGRITQGEVRVLPFHVPADDPTRSEIELFYESTDRFIAEIIGPDGERAALVPPDNDAALLVDGDVAGHIYHRLRSTVNASEDRHIDLFLDRDAPKGEWEIRLTGQNVRDGRYHAWIERDSGLSPVFSGPDVSEHSTTGTLCNGQHSITVGAINPHLSKLAFGSFSSSGPTRDGRMKPEIVAPGVGILAAKSTPPDGSRRSGYIRKDGTSMAAPHVAGTVALLYEAAGHPLDITDIRALLFSSAKRPFDSEQTRASQMHLLGHGALDILAAERAALALSEQRNSQSNADALENQHPSEETIMPDIEIAEQIADEPALHICESCEADEARELADSPADGVETESDLSLLNDQDYLQDVFENTIHSEAPDENIALPPLPESSTTFLSDGGPSITSSGSTIVTPSAITDWADLIKFRPPTRWLGAIGRRPSISYTWQRISAARSSNINLDFYPLYVSRMPLLHGRRLSAAELFEYFRKNINDFIDSDLSTFAGASAGDRRRWASSLPLGSVIYIDIRGPDNANVLCSEHSPNHWRFSTLTGHGPMGIDDEHPVSGTREFGFVGSSTRAVYYTMGADRSSYRFDRLANLAFNGGHQLWLSFQREFVNWVNSHGGRAARFIFGETRPNSHISRRENWARVRSLI